MQNKDDIVIGVIHGIANEGFLNSLKWDAERPITRARSISRIAGDMADTMEHDAMLTIIAYGLNVSPGNFNGSGKWCCRGLNSAMGLIEVWGDSVFHAINKCVTDIDGCNARIKEIAENGIGGTNE